ncbi:DUF2066 domain-containing protein [Saccharospirillum salsuginis]|uniref:DUF2066 domain-containing protein n=1 Tax=Saccharospirillum salsuginis TaxID=418750 RepID=A0A918KIR3_9GAMM|nr:DUF2066 domain-containing protein [Saccharospirillum salsuginis]GGX65365.1 hypothetical protein GCM10007392_36540 [Saccharospirillum salsuginis]
MSLRPLIALLLVIMSLPLWAAQTLELYDESAILAQNARPSDQNDAVAEALGRVLVRVTGDADIVDTEVGQAMVEDANDYLSTFRFERSDVTLTNLLGEPVATKRMIMRFDRGAVEQSLSRNRLPIWGPKRPETLIWMADRLDGSNRILADSDNSDLAQALKSSARERGVPLTLPLMDLDDSFQVNFTDIYGLFTADITEASERYRPDAVVLARLARENQGYQADFVFMMSDDRQRFRVQAESEEALMQAMVDRIAGRLADQYAVVMDPSMAGQISLRINAVNNLATLAAVERYLDSLNLVTSVTLRQVQPESVQFDLDISGDRNQLRDALALDERLQSVEEDDLQSQLDTELVYEWTER